MTYSTGSTLTNYTVAGLVPGTGYRFLVEARNALGLGVYPPNHTSDHAVCPDERADGCCGLAGPGCNRGNP